MTTRRLVIGIGNPDRGDDGIGPLVIAALAGRLPTDVTALTRSGDMLALVDDWVGADAVICIDAAAPMTAPGRVHRIDAGAGDLPPEPSAASSHAFGLPQAIALSRVLGTLPPRLVVFAVEGMSFDTGAPLSADVAAVVGDIAGQVIAELCELAEPADA